MFYYCSIRANGSPLPCTILGQGPIPCTSMTAYHFLLLSRLLAEPDLRKGVLERGKSATCKSDYFARLLQLITLRKWSADYLYEKRNNRTWNGVTYTVVQWYSYNLTVILGVFWCRFTSLLAMELSSSLSVTIVALKDPTFTTDPRREFQSVEFKRCEGAFNFSPWRLSS